MNGKDDPPDAGLPKPHPQSRPRNGSSRPVQARGRGRPCKLTPEVQEKIVGALNAGNYFETACAYAGVDRLTASIWLKKGNKQHRGMFRDFLTAITKAQADAETRSVANISKAGAEGNWTAEAWRLERKHPNRWGRVDRSKVELTGKKGGPIEVKTFADLVHAAGDDDEEK